MLEHDEAKFTEKRKRVYTFMKIPRELEKVRLTWINIVLFMVMASVIHTRNASWLILFNSEANKECCPSNSFVMFKTVAEKASEFWKLAMICVKDSRSL